MEISCSRKLSIVSSKKNRRNSVSLYETPNIVQPNIVHLPPISPKISPRLPPIHSPTINSYFDSPKKVELANSLRQKSSQFCDKFRECMANSPTGLGINYQIQSSLLQLKQGSLSNLSENDTSEYTKEIVETARTVLELEETKRELEKELCVPSSVTGQIIREYLDPHIIF